MERWKERVDMGTRRRRRRQLAWVTRAQNNATGEEELLGHTSLLLALNFAHVSELFWVVWGKAFVYFGSVFGLFTVLTSRH